MGEACGEPWKQEGPSTTSLHTFPQPWGRAPAPWPAAEGREDIS